MSDQPDAMATRTRDGMGRFDRDPETATRDAHAASLRGRGMSYRAIGEQLGISKQTAYDAVQRALQDTLAEPADIARQFELERLDAALLRLDGLEADARKVLERKHITVSNGKVIHLDDEPLEDDAPVLNAIAHLLKIEEARVRNSESRRKLLGLDAPVKAEVGGKLTYEVVGVGDEQL